MIMVIFSLMATELNGKSNRLTKGCFTAKNCRDPTNKPQGECPTNGEQHLDDIVFKTK